MSEPREPPTPRRTLLRARPLACILLCAAALRLAHWGAVRDEPFVARPAMDSAEYDRWARELAAGDWIGREPFFQAPLYPYLLGALYRVAGRSLDLVYLAQIALALAALALVRRAADRALGPPHGLVAAALGAVYLPWVFHDVQLAKESPALLVTALLLERLGAAAAAGDARRQSSAAAPTLGRWLAAGGALGLLALLRENALLLVPFLAPLALRPRVPRRAALARLAVFLAGVALPMAPVAARNAALGGGFLPTTFQGGVNLWIGNNPDADGTYRPLVPGKQVPAQERAEARRLAEQAEGRALGDAEVSRHWVGRVLAWARAEPARFARLQAAKLLLFLTPYEWPDAVDYYWMKSRSPALALPGLEWGALLPLAAAGLVLARRRRRELAPLLLFELGWLVATVAFFLFARYRLPAVPGLLALAAVPVVALGDAWRAGRRSGAALGAAAVVAAWLAPHTLGYAPRGELVEFNLGRIAEEEGDAAAARRHYRRALAADPEFFLAAMNLGTLAARGGDLAAGTRWLAEAVRLEPRSDDAWANLGAARLASGDLDGARRALERALALNPRHAAARSNRELLARRVRAAS